MALHPPKHSPVWVWTHASAQPYPVILYVDKTGKLIDYLMFSQHKKRAPKEQRQEKGPTRTKRNDSK